MEEFIGKVKNSPIVWLITLTALGTAAYCKLAANSDKTDALVVTVTEMAKAQAVQSQKQEDQGKAIDEIKAAVRSLSERKP